jgi:hypothetical protein
MKDQANIIGIDPNDLLLRVLIGESLNKLPSRFLVDKQTANDIVHTLTTKPRGAPEVLDDRKALHCLWNDKLKASKR